MSIYAKSAKQAAGYGIALSVAFVSVVMGVEFFRGVSFGEVLSGWLSLITFVAIAGTLFGLSTWLTSVLRQSPLSTEDRLDELERLKRRDLVTPEEYTAKRQEILKDL